MKHSTGIIILAAGSSSRLGEPKQLLQFNGTTLLAHTVQQALKAAVKAVVVVTGANNQRIEKEIDNPDVLTVHNEQWETGMGSSIKIGLKHLLLVYPDVQHCILAVCDQPFADAGIFSALRQAAVDESIVASSYADTLGTPALFSKAYFSDLLNLSGSEGAKKLLKKYDRDVIVIPFEKGAIDIDTINDYNQLISQ